MLERFRPAPAVRVPRLLLACAAVALSIELMRRAIPMYLPRDWQSAHELDALADWKGARLFLLGKSPYTPEGLAEMGQASMGHPPTAPFWYVFLADFDKSVAAQLTSALLLILLPLHTFLCAKEFRFPVPLATALLTASAIATTGWLQYHFDVVQTSEPIAFLYVVSWCLLRRGRDASAGVCLGAALTLKLFPGLLLVLLLLGRRFRALFAAAGTYLAVAAFMTRGYGLRCWLDFFQAQGGISQDWLGSRNNSSLHGLVVKVLTPSCVGPGSPSKRATLISIALSLALVALAAWLSNAHLKAARTDERRAIDVPFALFVLLSAFLNAWAWEHYFVLIIQPLFILLATFSATWWATLRRWREDEHYPSGRLGRVSLAALLGVAGVLLTVRALSVNIWERYSMSDLWFKHHLPFYHHQLHLLEIVNFGCWVLPISLCFLALPLSRRVLLEPALETRGSHP